MEENIVSDPFTQSDSMQLARLNQDLGSLDSQVNEGVLHPQEAEPEKQAILQERQQLLARQNQAQLAQKGQMRMQQQDEVANEHKMQQANMQDAASNFTKAMPRWERQPGDNGTYFYPDGKGGFSPLEAAAPDEQQPIEVPEGAAIEPPPEAPPEPPPEAVPHPAGGHVMSIQNGQFSEEHRWDQNGKYAGVTYPTDQNGQPIKPPWVREAEQKADGTMSALGFNPREQQALRTQAAALTPQPRFTGNAQHDAVTQRHYNDQLAQTTRMLGLDLIKQRAAKAKLDADAKRVEAKQNAELTQKQKVDLYEKKLGEIQKDIDKKRSELPSGKTMADQYPNEPYLWDREAHEEEAHRRAEREYGRHYGTKSDSKPTSKAAESGAAAPAESKPAPVPEVLNKMAPSAIEAELNRRAAAKAPPGFFERLVTPGRQGAGGVK